MTETTSHILRRWSNLSSAILCLLLTVAFAGCGLISKEDASEAIAEGRESQRLAIEEAAPLEAEIELLQKSAESLIDEIDAMEMELEELYIQEDTIRRNEMEPLYQKIGDLDEELREADSRTSRQSGQSGQRDGPEDTAMSKVRELELQLETIFIEQLKPLHSQMDDAHRSQDFDSDAMEAISKLEDQREILGDELDLLYDKRDDANQSMGHNSKNSDSIRELNSQLRDLEVSARELERESSESRRSHEQQIQVMRQNLDTLIDQESSIGHSEEDQSERSRISAEMDALNADLSDLERIRNDNSNSYQDKQWALEDERDSINRQLQAYFDEDEDLRMQAKLVVDALEDDIDVLEGEIDVINDSINSKYNEERDRKKTVQLLIDSLEQQRDEIETTQMKPIQEEILRLLDDIKKFQDERSSQNVEDSDGFDGQDVPEEVKAILEERDGLRNQIREIEQVEIPAIRDQIDELRNSRFTKRNALRAIHEDMKPKIDQLDEIYGQIDEKRAALEGTILDILEAANEKYNDE